jgi:peptide/nickel transport system ATP-binding protein
MNSPIPDRTLLEVSDLHTYFETDEGTVRAVDGVSFDVRRGETVAIVGESGSGKTVTGESITRLFRSPPGHIPAGSIRFDGREVTGMTDGELRAFRGARVSHVFQNPQGALNPVYTIGWQLREAIELHQDVTRSEARDRAIDLLTQVGIPEAGTRLDDYPHELSGGQKQRVTIAIALACEPDLLIADEPTTALDVTIQAQILKLFDRLRRERDMAILFITHDLGVVAQVADRVVVMYAGKVMERGTVEEIFGTPAHPYTRALLACLPGEGSLGGIPGDIPDPTAPPDGCRFADRCPHAIEECREGDQPPMHPVEGEHVASCVHFGPNGDPDVVLQDDTLERPSPGTGFDGSRSRSRGTASGGTRGRTPTMRVRGLEKHYPVTEGFLKEEVGRVRAVDGIDFDLSAGEAFGIVGESGCGKTTVAHAMLRLTEPTAGEVLFRGEDVTGFDGKRLRRFRRDAQMVFQDPNSSFDPRMSVGDAIAEPLIVQGMRDADRRRAIVEDLLERVGLSPEDAKRYPHEFSGGQKQRIALARALSVNPDLIVADEPVSALDVSIQAEILALLKRLQAEFDLMLVVISHDLGVVREICDRVAVMYLGEFVEVGPTEELFSDPKHPYTRALLSAIPTPDPARRGLGVELRGDVPDPASPPDGCRFHTRCPEVIPPDDIELEQGTWRNVLHLRQRVRDGTIDPEGIAEVAAIGTGRAVGSTGSIGNVPDEALEGAIRDEYDLPDRLADPRADEVLNHALDRIVDGDLEAARETLAEAFVTPCELEEPDLVERFPGREVACHLHDRRFEDEGSR